jgi:hypothetical protein
MADQPETIKKWHRKFAVDLFDHTWDLLESSHRSEDDDLDMLASALASLHHWRQVGEPENLSVSDWQVSRVLAVLDHPGAAARFAGRALRLAEDHDLGPFYAGYAHEALARSASITGDGELRDHHLAAANALVAEVENQGEAEVLRKDLDELGQLTS